MSRITAIAAIAILAVIGRDWAPLALAASTLLAVAGVSWWDARIMHYSAIEASSG